MYSREGLRPCAYKGFCRTATHGVQSNSNLRPVLRMPFVFNCLREYPLMAGALALIFVHADGTHL